MNDESINNSVSEATKEIASIPFMILSLLCGFTIASTEFTEVQGIANIVKYILTIIFFGVGTYAVIGILYIICMAIVVGGLKIDNPKIYRPIVCILSVVIALLVYFVYFR